MDSCDPRNIFFENQTIMAAWYDGAILRFDSRNYAHESLRTYEETIGRFYPKIYKNLPNK
eukprot:TRINITY_DN6973_c0_g1_i1.p1 TRINITY_DN6973_c0_g1~~TRINITY_DN6973_c0_g1_i1.p1  ORF type:complete len:60 (-),score=11.18 TRINITY_DN6973_c0_g1_i1:270-449(-)